MWSTIHNWRSNTRDYAYLRLSAAGAIEDALAAGRSMKLEWRHIELSRQVGREETADEDMRPLADSHLAAFPTRTISQRAVDVLADLLVGSCELLPLKSALGTYYCAHCVRKVDCLDPIRSEFRRHPGGLLVAVESWVFDPSRLPRDAHVLRVPQDSFTYVCSEVFIARVREAKLRGFWFQQLWSEASGPVPGVNSLFAPRPETPRWELDEIRVRDGG